MSDPLSKKAYVVICLSLPQALTLTGTTLKHTFGRPTPTVAIETELSDSMRIMALYCKLSEKCADSLMMVSHCLLLAYCFRHLLKYCSYYF